MKARLSFRGGESPVLTAAMNRPSFSLAAMPPNIQKRSPLPSSIHQNQATKKWIATITVRPPSDGAGSNRQGFIKQGDCLYFTFDTDREASKFAKAYTPPRMRVPGSHCESCTRPLNTKPRSTCICRNCGACVCEKCSTKWGIDMVPKTYGLMGSGYTPKVRVCKSCDWLSNAFCMSLLRGQSNDAFALYETGNINLRCTFADINGEAMFPVHCAVLGGSLTLLKWLVDTNCCPTRRGGSSPLLQNRSILTSNNRSMLDLAMTGKPKMDILRHLVIEMNMSILDTKNPKLAQVTLENLLRETGNLARGHDRLDRLLENEYPTTVHVVEDDNNTMLPPDSMCDTSIDDACVICCEKPMDCVLVPCGHQLCCSGCGTKISTCPMCKTKCTVLKIFRR